LGTVSRVDGVSLDDRTTSGFHCGTFVWCGVLQLDAKHHQGSGAQEAIIGITVVRSRGGVILAVSRVAGGKEELEHLLTGDILNVTKGEIGQRLIVFAALGAFYATSTSALSSSQSDPEKAFADGIRVRLWDFLFYARSQWLS